MIGCKCVLRAPISVSGDKLMSYFFLLYITLKSMLGSLLLGLPEDDVSDLCGEFEDPGVLSSGTGRVWTLARLVVSIERKVISSNIELHYNDFVFLHRQQ